ncbi:MULTISPECIES: hypothetical protein [Bacillus]|uniref:Uncharacterized protein n=1 Tax=Bacillus glycinifermentans TaxID=1664069 RepID=A0AAJ3YWN5_9BACI|nr:MULTISPECIES: hypothetical protein [Bacillus]KKB74872.1 hypothetical protein TH62_05050 [Bacillus sp. TH008]MDU0071548.1 hypothetical protein [Bacillus sp. IG6]MED8019359.1 hypothetical protein [Bacillus glycinifermentans]QAT64461.1 hypothetical protein EQZ20_05760 [Bacillus glycinifermentans]WKB78399.1 hypothetical protein QYM22_05980 [Bacillus glycinifermentans]
MCPVCNGMLAEARICPRCGSEMADAGRVTDFYGPYSPYMEFDSFMRKETSCIHLYTCQDCSYDERVEIELTEG